MKKGKAGSPAWFGLLVVIVALLFMLGDLGINWLGNLTLWPIVILLIGIKLVIHQHRCC